MLYGTLCCDGQGRHQLLQIYNCQGGFSADTVLDVFQNILSEFSGPSKPLHLGGNKILWLDLVFIKQPANRILPKAQVSADFTVADVFLSPLYCH
jgi:hypothetical protein